MNPPPKYIFKSKTAFANALLVVAGALGSASPDFKQILADNANLILMAAGGVGLILRFATKGKVVLFPTDS